MSPRISMVIWFKVKISDISQEMLDKAKQNSLFTARKATILLVEWALLSFESTNVPVTLYTKGYTPIEDIDEELSESEWNP